MHHTAVIAPDVVCLRWCVAVQVVHSMPPYENGKEQRQLLPIVVTCVYVVEPVQRFIPQPRRARIRSSIVGRPPGGGEPVVASDARIARIL